MADQYPQGSFAPLSTASTNVTLPEKAALSSVTTVAEDPNDYTRRASDSSTGRDAKGKAGVEISPFDVDCEASPADASPPHDSNMWHTHPCTPSRFNSKSIRLFWPNDHQVWPRKDYWVKKARAAKKKRGCTCLAAMSKRNRIIVKVLIVLLIIGIGLGVGFGISRSR